MPRLDDAFIALGTTIKVAGSQEAFRAVDFDAVVAVAKAAKAAGASRLGVVSAMGASSKSSVFYSRVKGEMEEALSGLGFDTLVFARPSLLIGDRAALGQPVRSGEETGEKVARWLGPLIPANYRPINVKAVARALVQAVRETKGRRIILSGELRKFLTAARFALDYETLTTASALLCRSGNSSSPSPGLSPSVIIPSFTTGNSVTSSWYQPV